MTSPRKLSFREPSLSRGGWPTEPGEPETALSRTHHVLLIHGYNNDRKQADRSFEAFRSFQAELGGDEEVPRDQDPLVHVYWPGEGVLLFELTSGAFYADAVGKARETANLLAAVLEEAESRLGLLRIDVVAHSLGCRLAVELIRHLRHSRVLVRRVVLMAAAVPTAYLEPGGPKRLRGGLELTFNASAWNLDSGLLSLYSGSDGVLRGVFPLGQLDARETCLQQALGAGPWFTWPLIARFEQEEICGAGHSDYWGWKRETQETARRAHAQVRRFLGLARRVDRETPERSICDRRGTGDRIPSERIAGEL